MTQYKIAVTPVHHEWSYCNHALSQQTYLSVIAILEF